MFFFCFILLARHYWNTRPLMIGISFPFFKQASTPPPAGAFLKRVFPVLRCKAEEELHCVLWESRKKNQNLRRTGGLKLCVPPIYVRICMYLRYIFSRFAAVRAGCDYYRRRRINKMHKFSKWWMRCSEPNYVNALMQGRICFASAGKMIAEQDGGCGCSTAS